MSNCFVVGFARIPCEQDELAGLLLKSIVVRNTPLLFPRRTVLVETLMAGFHS